MVPALALTALSALGIPNADLFGIGYGGPGAEPLGLLIHNSTTIHLLRVESATRKVASLKVMASLKASGIGAPVRQLRAYPGLGPEASALFSPGTIVLCFARAEGGFLHANGRWAVGGANIFLPADCWYVVDGGHHAVTYDGPTAGLRQAVADVLAGREPTITARALRPWGAPKAGPWWRIKAGLKIKRFVVSEESPYFFAWGAGWSDEVPRLLRSLNAIKAEERLAALKGLAEYRPPSKAALVGLRRALRDPSSEVASSAAAALVRLDPADGDGMKALVGALHHALPETRAAHAEALASLGPLARPAFPALLAALRDKDGTVRLHAAEAIGIVGPGSPHPGKTVAALVAALKAEQCAGTAKELVGALRRFGPLAWEAALAIWKHLACKDQSGRFGVAVPFQVDPGAEAVSLLGQLRPLPVESLVEISAGKRGLLANAESEAMEELGTAGSQSRPALPRLRALLPLLGGDRREAWRGIGAARAILKIAPEEAPALVPPLLAASKQDGGFLCWWTLPLLARCGKAARPHVPTMVALLERDPSSLQAILPLLGPEHRQLLPALMQHDGDGPSVEKADILLMLGLREKAIKQAIQLLQRPERWRRPAAARWLGKLCPEAKNAEPALQAALQDDADGVRARMALALWRLRGSSGPRPLRTAFTALEGLLTLAEGDSPAIGKWRDSAFWAEHQEAAHNQECEAVGEAIYPVLQHLEVSRDVQAALAYLLEDKRPHVRLVAALALARVSSDHPKLMPALRRLLRGHPHFFYFAADSLAGLKTKAAPVAPELLPLLYHPHEEVQQAAEYVLRRCGKLPTVKEPKFPPPKFDRLWADLAGKDAMAADLAVRDLVRAGPKAVALLAKRLKPPTGPTAKRFRQLLEALDSDDFEARETASAELARHIEAVGPALRKARSSGVSVEAGQRIDKLLALLEWPATPEYRRRLRCLRVLEEIGSRVARSLLAQFLG
jgi:HEAT repeat protein